MELNRREALGGSLLAFAAPTGAAAAAAGAAPESFDLGPVPPWFDREALRISWHLMRELDGSADGKAFVEKAMAANVNAICMTVGGSIAFYPSKIPFHQRSSALPAGGDLIGDVVTHARANGIRFFARFDFSRQPLATAQAHPEWFYRHIDGSVSTYQERARPCLLAGFYRTVAPAIIMEVMDRYRPSLFFINNFNNQLVTSNVEPAPCQCDSCKTIFAQTHGGRPLPTTFTPEYWDFLREQTSVTAQILEAPARLKYPETIAINANCNPSDGMHTETRMAFPGRQQFAYDTTEMVDRQLNSHPGKVSLNLATTYSNNLVRSVLMPASETRVRLFQSIASGSHPCISVTGTMDQFDRDTIAAAIDVWAWAKRNSDLYVSQRNAARVLLLCKPEVKFRSREPAANSSENGLYQILSENHVALAVADTEAPLRNRPEDFDIVLVSRGAPLKQVEQFVRKGGRAIYVDQHPGFAVPAAVAEIKLKSVAYWRVRDRTKLPGVSDFDFMEAGGGPGDVVGKGDERTITQYPPEADAPLTFVPSHWEEPAEQAGLDQKDTTIPGLITRSVDAGSLAFLPWDLGGLYNRLYFPAHAQVLMALVRQLQPQPEIQTDAPPGVQMMLMRQEGRKERQLNLVNLCGQTQRGWAPPPVTGPISISLKGTYASVQSRALAASLPFSHAGGRTVVTLPSLHEFDSLVLVA